MNGYPSSHSFCAQGSLVLCVAVFLVVLASGAQQAESDTFSAGCGSASAGSLVITDTIGQPIIGEATTPESQLDEGLWPTAFSPPLVAYYGLDACSGQTLSIFADDILRSAKDADGDSMAVTAVSPLSEHHGAVSLTQQQITYTAPFRYKGSDTFTCVITDASGETVTATIYITVLFCRSTFIQFTY